MGDYLKQQVEMEIEIKRLKLELKRQAEKRESELK